MESWSFGSDGKGFLFSEEIEIPIDAFARGRKGLLWDNKAGFNFDKEPVQNMEFMELGFPDLVRKPFRTNQRVDILSGLVGNDSGSNLVASPPGWITSSSSLGEGESMSKFSSPVYEYTSHDSSLIALNLGMLVDGTDVQNSHQHSKENSKSAGTRSSNYHIPTCQVLGCNMDLSSSKEYHKRHRVCDAHSKTAKVIVNGIEQRFCQQCSRFHLLREFDDAKRSCRRRLAGHNKRRRKAKLETLNCEPHKLLRSCQGTRNAGTSFVFSDILPGGILYPEEYEQANQYGNVKYEDQLTYSPCVTPMANRQLVPMSFHHLDGLGKQHASGVSSSANECSVSDTATTIQKVIGASKSSCALSLLSAQSYNLSSHSAGVQVPSPLMEPVMSSDYSHAVNFQVHTDRAFQGSGCLSTKYCFSPENGPTFDLLQLSSHLHRVEQEKTFLRVKQENGECYCYPTA